MKKVLRALFLNNGFSFLCRAGRCFPSREFGHLCLEFLLVGDDIHGETFYFFEVVYLHAESDGNDDSCIEFKSCRSFFVSGSALDADELLGSYCLPMAK